MKSILLFNLLLIAFWQLNLRSSAQSCLTDIDSLRFQYEINNPQSFDDHSITQNKRIFHLVFHIFADSNGDFGLTDSVIHDKISDLNLDFLPSGVSFRISTIDSISYCQYNLFEFPQELSELKVLYYNAGIINIYLVDEITDQNGNYLYEGYAEYPGRDDLIIVPKHFFAEYGISHQMGHFFGLYHTFEEIFGYELPDSSNCTTAGDLFCDTPADTIVEITTDCNSTLLIVPGNIAYNPPISNIMSNWPACRCRFTIQQYNKIALESKTTRAYLW